jgi:creatinine amidohydrolase
VFELLPSTTAYEERDRGASIAVLPIGSFEQHGEFLPLITDTVVACAISRKISERYTVMLLPPLTITCSHEHTAWPGTVSISATTLFQLVNDIAQNLTRSGPKRLVLVNGHGGNYVLSNIVQEYTSAHGPTMSLFPQSHDWTKARIDAGMQTDNHEDMHAGELETSILLHVAPGLVRPGNDTADWISNDRKHLLSLGMTAYTKSGVIGRPSLGTAEKGQAALASLTRAFGDHLAALTAQS